MLGTMSNGDSGKDPAIVSARDGGRDREAATSRSSACSGACWSTAAPRVGSYNLPLWQTEHKCGNYPWNPAGYPAYKGDGAQQPGLRASRAGAASATGSRAGVTAYSAWNMVLDTVGKGNDTTRDWAQNALLTVNTSSKTLNLTPAYYVFRHVSQFVDAGREGRRDDAAATRSRSRTRTGRS